MSDWAREQYGLRIRTTPLHQGMYPPDSFDVVTMFDVLEHVEDPKETVRVVRSILEDDGLFVLSYPDWGSIFARLLKRRWWFTLSVHLFYFTRKTIAKLLEQEGFVTGAVVSGAVLRGRRGFARGFARGSSRAFCAAAVCAVLRAQRLELAVLWPSSRVADFLLAGPCPPPPPRLCRKSRGVILPFSEMFLRSLRFLSFL